MKFNDVVVKMGELVSGFLSAVSPAISVSFDNFSSFDPEENVIYIGLLPMTEENPYDDFHKGYYRASGFDYESYGISFETFTILHELGHMESNPTEKEYQEYYRLTNIINNSNMELSTKANKYFALDLEYKANQWAFNFLKDNLDIVRVFDKAFNLLKSELLNCE